MERPIKKRLSDEDRKIKLTGAWCSGMTAMYHISSTDNMRDFVGFCVSVMYPVVLMNKVIKHLIQDFVFC